MAAQTWQRPPMRVVEDCASHTHATDTCAQLAAGSDRISRPLAAHMPRGPRRGGPGAAAAGFATGSQCTHHDAQERYAAMQGTEKGQATAAAPGRTHAAVSHGERPCCTLAATAPSHHGGGGRAASDAPASGASHIFRTHRHCRNGCQIYAPATRAAVSERGLTRGEHGLDGGEGMNGQAHQQARPATWHAASTGSSSPATFKRKGPTRKAGMARHPLQRASAAHWQHSMAGQSPAGVQPITAGRDTSSVARPVANASAAVRSTRACTHAL